MFITHNPKNYGQAPEVEPLCEAHSLIEKVSDYMDAEMRRAHHAELIARWKEGR